MFLNEMADRPGRPRFSSLIRSFGPALGLLGIGWYFAVSIVGGLGIGALLDSWLETGPWLALTGLAVGLTVAIYGGYKLLRRVMSTRTTTTGMDDV